VNFPLTRTTKEFNMGRSKKIVVVVMVCIGFLCFGGQAQAQMIGFAAGQPVPSAGTISASGGFDCGTGNTVYQVTLIVQGNGVNQRTDQTFAGSPQSGKWSIISQNLPTGSYNVYVQLYYQVGGAGNPFKLNPVAAPNNPYFVPPGSKTPASPLNACFRACWTDACCGVDSPTPQHTLRLGEKRFQTRRAV
jgi:hypothetical protein